MSLSDNAGADQSEEANGMLRVGFLNGGSEGIFAALRDSFVAGLSDGGFKVGANVQIKYKWANRSTEVLDSFARELVQENVDVIVATGGGRTPFSAKESTSKIPIVFVTGSDPIAIGLIKSLNKPEANLTGITFWGVNLIAKRIQILKEIKANTRKIALLIGINTNETKVALDNAHDASKALAVQTTAFQIRTHQDVERTIETVLHRKFDGIVYGSDPVFISLSERLAKLAVVRGIPAVGQRQEDVKAGGLAAYGTSIPAAYREAGQYAAKILRGTKPRDLPVIQSKHFHLSINIKAAKKLGLQFPPPILASANTIIE